MKTSGTWTIVVADLRTGEGATYTGASEFRIYGEGPWCSFRDQRGDLYFANGPVLATAERSIQTTPKERVS